MKNFFMWIGVFFSLVFIAGLTPKTEHTMLVLETIAAVIWCFGGFVMAVRGLYRIISKAPRRNGF